MSVETLEATAFALNCAARALHGVAAARREAPLVPDTNVDAGTEATATYDMDASTNA